MHIIRFLTALIYIFNVKGENEKQLNEITQRQNEVIEQFQVNQSFFTKRYESSHEIMYIF